VPCRTSQTDESRPGTDFTATQVRLRPSGRPSRVVTTMAQTSRTDLLRIRVHRPTSTVLRSDTQPPLIYGVTNEMCDKLRVPAVGSCRRERTPDLLSPTRIASKHREIWVIVVLKRSIMQRSNKRYHEICRPWLCDDVMCAIRQPTAKQHRVSPRVDTVRSRRTFRVTVNTTK